MRTHDTRKHSLPAVWCDPVMRWRLYLLSRGLSPETVRLRVSWVGRFARAVQCGPWRVHKTALVEWSADSQWRQETRRCVHQSVKLFYEWAISEGLTDKSPDIPLLQKGQARPRPADQASVQVALSSSDMRVVLMVRLAAQVGLRRGEVSRVHTRDIVADIVGYSLIVHGKGAKDRIVPLPDDLAALLLQAPPGWLFPGACDGHLSPGWVGKLVGRALPQGVTMHQLRHSFASRGYALTHDLVSVQALLGHSSPQTTLAYIAIPSDALRCVVSAVNHRPAI